MFTPPFFLITVFAVFNFCVSKLLNDIGCRCVYMTLAPYLSNYFYNVEINFFNYSPLIYQRIQGLRKKFYFHFQDYVDLIIWKVDIFCILNDFVTALSSQEHLSKECNITFIQLVARYNSWTDTIC